MKLAPLFTVSLLLAGAAYAKGPVKVFVLSGQSNMEGKAAVHTLDAVINDRWMRPTFEHLKPNGKWIVRDDVFVTYLDKKTKGESKLPLFGPLAVGFGAQKQIRDDNNKRVTVPSIGPELGIGMILGNHFDEPVLLIKAAWGGRAVRYSFRPPSAMPSEEQVKAEVAAINAKRQATIDKQKANPRKKPKRVGPPATFEARMAGYGSDYRKILSETKRALEDIAKYVPAYNPEEGYELAGFIWFQGWNDGIGSGNPDYVEQMSHFIRDIRRDLKTPELPFVIGELGTDGPNATGWIETFRQQQAAIAAQDEFKSNVRLAHTAKFWPKVPDMSEKWTEFRALAKANEQKAKDDPTRIDPGAFYRKNWELKYKPQLSYTSDKRYHYLGSGACYYQMGQSMGSVMVQLLKSAN